MNKHDEKHDSSEPGLHKDWRTWVVVVLMVAAMAIYILSDNESLQSSGGEQVPVPAEP